MEMEGKFPRIRSGNGRSESPKVGRKREDQEDRDEKPGKRPSAALDIASPGGGLLCGWPSSRIVRVSRASGGKDRHSKVWTSKGLRDRRVRLSVNTAIQFYDLQDRLGYDQPSKAVEWLLKAAAASIDELPSINTSFPGQDASDEKRSTEMKMAEELYQQQQQKGSNFSKSACSSTSETSKGSGLSLSRCESRMKARERARGRAAEKEKEKEHHNVSQSSFTDLLTGVNGNGNSGASPNRESPASSRQWCSAPMDYFAAGMLGLSSTPSSSANLLGQIHTSQLFNVPAEHYSFLPDHLASNGHGNGTGNGHGCDYNLNFSISPSGYAGFNRGTLQSNSSSLPHQLQRFPSSSSSLFTATAPPVEDHHHFLPGFDARLQLCYGDSDQKGKVKN